MEDELLTEMAVICARQDKVDYYKVANQGDYMETAKMLLAKVKAHQLNRPELWEESTQKSYWLEVMVTIIY